MIQFVLHSAKLYFGSGPGRDIAAIPDSGLTIATDPQTVPLDSQQIVALGNEAFEAIAKFCAGHRIADCRATYHHFAQQLTFSASGVTVIYVQKDFAPSCVGLTTDQIVEQASLRTEYVLGTVQVALSANKKFWMAYWS